MNKPLPVVTECVRSVCEQREAELHSWGTDSGGHSSQLDPSAAEDGAEMLPNSTCFSTRHLSNHMSRLAILAGVEIPPGQCGRQLRFLLPGVPTLCNPHPLSVGETCEYDMVHDKREGIL